MRLLNKVTTRIIGQLTDTTSCGSPDKSCQLLGAFSVTAASVRASFGILPSSVMNIHAHTLSLTNKVCGKGRKSGLEMLETMISSSWSVEFVFVVVCLPPLTLSLIGADM